MIHRNEKVLQYELPLQIERDPSDGYIAICPTWPDCYAQGDTIDQAVLEVTAVAQTLIELYTEEELPIPLVFEKARSIENTPFTVPVIVTA